MNHEGLATIVKRPTVSTAERIAAKAAAGAFVEDVNTSVNTPEDDIIAENIKKVNEKTVVEASEGTVLERGIEKTAEELAAEDKALREKATMKIVARKKKRLEEFSQAQKIAEGLGGKIPISNFKDFTPSLEVAANIPLSVDAESDQQGGQAWAHRYETAKQAA